MDDVICTPGLRRLFAATVAIGGCHSLHACSFAGENVSNVIANIN
jgi:hypothetical protein